MIYSIVILLVLPVLAGCSAREAAEHDDHAEERPVVSFTHFTEHSELFVEFPDFARGEETPLLSHFTDLASFKPVMEGTVTVLLRGGGQPDERFTVTGAERPGIFRPVAVPQYAGSRQLIVELETPVFRSLHDLGSIEVCEMQEHDPHDEAHEGEEEEHGITFLKEQQWQLDFATAPVAVKPLRASIPAPGMIRARPDGEALITAPVSGRLIAGKNAFPALGVQVARNSTLALLLPELSDTAELSSLELSVEETRIAHSLARQERERLERLLRMEAVPERRVIESRNWEQAAEAALLAARRRLGQYQGVQSASGGEAVDRVALRAPIAGAITNVLRSPGQFVERGNTLFEITNLDRLWLEVQMPEVDASLIRRTNGAWMEVQGHAESFEINAELGGVVVSTGSRVDPVSRTVPLIFDFPNPGRLLKVGMAVRVHVLTGETATGPAVPKSAILDFEGRDVVYVQTSGESFERRAIQPGIREGDYIQVLDGLEAGERIVSRGTYYIRLASTTTSTPAHGHAH